MWSGLGLSDCSKDSHQGGTIFLLPGKEGVKGAIAFYDGPVCPEAFGHLAEELPELSWAVQSDDPDLLENVFLGVCLEFYHFSLTDQQKDTRDAHFLVPVSFPRERLKRLGAIVKAIWRGRDLINMPANLLGPQELADLAAEELRERGASVTIIKGRP